MALKYTSFSVHEAQCQPGSLFHLAPYQREHDDKTYYGRISRKTEGGGTRISGCLVSLASELRDEIVSRGYPGGFFVKFAQLADDSWLVEFHAQNILAGVYLKLSAEDMNTLLNEMEE